MAARMRGTVRYFQGVGGKRDQRVDLFGDLHRADLGCDGGGRPRPATMRAAEDGAKLAHDADGDDLGDHGLGVLKRDPPE